MDTTWTLFVIFPGLFCLTASQQLYPFGGECRVEKRISDLQPCLNEIYNLATNDSVFWFGTDLESHCKQTAIQNSYDWSCYVGSTGDRKTSIFERLFSVDTGTNRFAKYLTVTYASVEGNYTACGGNFTMPRRTIDVQPDTIAVPPWFVRNSPLFNFQVDANSQYTIIIMDGAFGYILAVLAHYPLPLVVYQYQSPVNARNHTTPIVYLVYKENDSGVISSTWIEAMQASQMGRKPFDLSGFSQQNQLEGPIAMNLLMIRNDAFSASKLKEQGGPDFCPQFVGEALRAKNEVFIQQMDFSQMDMLLSLTFVSPPASFSVCCQNYEYGVRTVNANPLSDAPIDPIMVRDPPVVSTTRANPRNPTRESARLFTIIAVDPTIPKNALATTDRPYLQWLIVNVDEDSFSNLRDEQIILKYAPTIPAPQSPAHTIYFFLFEQQGTIDNTHNSTIAIKYSDSSCVDYLLGRCLFRITDFIADNNLTLRAANWILTVNDAYARYWLIKSGQIEWDICADQPGYQVPCPVPGELQIARPARVSEINSASAVHQKQTLILLILLTCFFGGF